MLATVKHYLTITSEQLFCKDFFVKSVIALSNLVIPHREMIKTAFGMITATWEIITATRGMIAETSGIIKNN